MHFTSIFTSLILAACTLTSASAAPAPASITGGALSNAREGNARKSPLGSSTSTSLEADRIRFRGPRETYFPRPTLRIPRPPRTAPPRPKPTPKPKPTKAPKPKPKPKPQPKPKPTKAPAPEPTIVELPEIPTGPFPPLPEDGEGAPSVEDTGEAVDAAADV